MRTTNEPMTAAPASKAPAGSTAPVATPAVASGDTLRGVVVLVVSLILTLFACIFTGYVLLAPKNSDTGTYITPFKIWSCSNGFTGTCSSTDVKDMSGCDDVKTRLQASEAFGLLSIFAAAAAFVGGILEIRNVTKWVSIIFLVWFAIFAVIAWTPVAWIYNNTVCSISFSDVYKYGAGFGLMVAAWSLSIVTILFWIIRGCMHSA